MSKTIEVAVKGMDDYYDCYDVMIITLCDYFGIDGNRIFSWRWGFNYAEKKPNALVSLYDNMYVNRDQDRVCKLLNKYLGLEIHGYFYEDMGELDPFVREKIDSGIPVGIVLDTINCYWNPLYQKQSIKHCSLIVGYDEKSYYIKEPYFSNEVYEIDKGILNKDLVRVVCDIYHHSPLEFDFRRMIREGFDYVEDNGAKRKGMICYANDLLRLVQMDFKDKLYQNDLRYVPSLRAIKNLESERKGLLELLREYPEEVPEKVIGMLEECVGKWQICLNRMMRVYLTKKTGKLESVSGMILEIAALEQEIYERTLDRIASIT